MEQLLKRMFAIKDRALDAYNQPFTLTTTAQAVRSFTDEINSDPDRSGVAKHPDDYDLYIIAHYDDQNGQIFPLDKPELVVRGKDLVRPKGE